MGLFDRRKERNFEVERGDKEQLKPLKDLSPENAPRRREPVKPWGRKERLFVAFVLFLTVGISGMLSLASRSFKLPGFPRIEKPDLGLIGGEETIILGSNKADEDKSEKALSSFKKSTKDLSGVYGVYVIRLTDGSSYGLYQNEISQAASLIKLPILGALYKDSESGNISLDDIYTLKDEDKLGGAGSLSQQPEGYKISYKEVARLMAHDSDNTALKIIRNTLGDDKINKFIEGIGMNGTSFADNNTTPHDVGLFFQKLWEGKILNKLNTRELLDFLTQTSYEDWLAKGLPVGVKFAHKYGREINVVNDAGIVYADQPFVMVVMSKGVVEEEADNIFPEIAKSIYGIESSTKP
ncbi:serine hydrolase [Candidatus Woesebacteria bacterium]|nr:serine hydrolase [Candidatus Woesebacteria bacterium]